LNKGIAVSVEHVSKKFCTSLRRSSIYGLTDLARNLMSLSSHSDRLRKEEFWAVDDVSFEVKLGETLGIIGANGSGKTTMLSMLNGIIWPDKGIIQIRGRSAALIAVGAGFHPMLSGRENIYVQGGILGLSKKEIDRKFDDIIEFADIGDFINAPVKFYSSGMVVRLGFAIAINIEPEVLLLDEVLSVGDLSFQNKSLRRVADLRKKANAVVFVSHNLDHVRNICDRVLILTNGKQVFSGSAQDAVSRYHEMSREVSLASARREGLGAVVSHLSSGDVIISDAGILDREGQKTDKIAFGDDITAYCDFDLLGAVESPLFSLSVLNDKGITCISQTSLDCRYRVAGMKTGKYRLKVVYKNPNLVPGVYAPIFGLRNSTTGELYEKGFPLAAFRIEGNAFPRGVVHVESEWRVEPVQSQKECVSHQNGRPSGS
jgi:lipopolysaccharide transport system ATP-binding protein